MRMGKNTVKQKKTWDRKERREREEGERWPDKFISMHKSAFV